MSTSLGKRKRVAKDIPDQEESENVNVNLLKFLVPKVMSSSPAVRATKRPTSQSTLIGAATPRSSVSAATSAKSPPVKKSKAAARTQSNIKKPLTQLHLTLGKTALKTCSLCGLSYTRGAPEDEDLHKKHCARISRGTEWGREEARSEGKDVTVVEEGIIVRGPKGSEERGRIIKFNASIGGKVGAKVSLGANV